MAKTATCPLTRELLRAQRNEITEHMIYNRLAGVEKNPRNADVLRQIAQDESGHYQFWKGHTVREVKANRWQVFKYYWLARIFGMTFSIKLMERGEGQAQVTYERIARTIPEARRVAEDEDRHEQELLGLLDEERLRYVGSMVLGLNDALVELTGALAGLSLAMRNTRLIALAGLITGIAASFSMAASEYLSRKSEQGQHDPLKSSLYTGIAYVVTVLLLIAPYLLLSHYLLCLGVTMAIAILIILAFNYYVSVAKDLPFRRHFLQMAGISLGVAAISFAIGYLIRVLLGVDL
jgi:VIT1/CCC1 family predicted Fe2+/Mn2+ transporter